MNRSARLVCLGLVVAIVIGILVPTVTYLHFTNAYSSDFDSYRNQIKDLQQQLDELIEENRQLREKNFHLTEIIKPNLVTSLGWYLHKSDDPVDSSRNTFTIYGKISNTGLFPANNVELTIKFYGNDTLFQSSKIHVGTIQSLNSTRPAETIRKDIAWSMADSVTTIDVSLRYE